MQERKLEGKLTVPATASALSKEMLTTQNIPKKLKFSTGRKLIGISQKMKKTVLTVLTALVKGDVKSRNSILGFTENFSFRRSSNCVPVISRQKKTNLKTTTAKNMRSVIYRIGSYIVGSRIYII